jgi:uncharacterized membrane protein
MSMARSADARPASLPDDARAVARPRLDSVDLLRGLVMALMALDHARDFFGASGPNPRDVAEPALFLTRWITHYCAPVFIFLAGVSAFLYGARGRSMGEVSRFLFTRGFFLIVIEFTIVRFGWTFSLSATSFLASVIWVIGASMVALSVLIWLPRAVLALFAIGLIAGHNAFDGVRAETLGGAGWLWTILHQPGNVRIGETGVYVLYPLIPWIGVMAAGYALGPIFQRDPAIRRRWLIGLGAALTAGFILLRASNLYGDPAAWQMQENWLSTVLSFINCEKYPPSLLYLMMTIGPALILLAVFEGARGRLEHDPQKWMPVLRKRSCSNKRVEPRSDAIRTDKALARWITTFGRVPFLFYVAHIYLLHLLAGAMVLAIYDDLSWMTASPPRKPADYGLSLPGVYAVWLIALAMLYPLCRWFAGLKQRRKEWWWSYL